MYQSVNSISKQQKSDNTDLDQYSGGSYLSIGLVRDQRCVILKNSLICAIVTYSTQLTGLRATKSGGAIPSVENRNCDEMSVDHHKGGILDRRQLPAVPL